MSPEARKQYRPMLCDWLRANGIDPNVVPADSPLDISPDETRLNYEEFAHSGGQLVLDNDGHPVLLALTATITTPRPAELIEAWRA